MKDLNIGDIFYILTGCGVLRICKIIKLIKLGDKMRRIIYEHTDDVFPITTSGHIDICIDRINDTIFMDFSATLYTEKKGSAKSFKCSY